MVYPKFKENDWVYWFYIGPLPRGGEVRADQIETVMKDNPRFGEVIYYLRHSLTVHRESETFATFQEAKEYGEGVVKGITIKLSYQDKPVMPRVEGKE